VSERAEKLKPVLAELSAEDRAELMDYLMGLEAEREGELSQEEWEVAWVQEVERRMADQKAGKTVAIPAEEVMRRMKEKYG